MPIYAPVSIQYRGSTHAKWSALGAEAGGSLSSRHSQGYTEELCLKNKQTNKPCIHQNKKQIKTEAEGELTQT